MSFGRLTQRTTESILAIERVPVRRSSLPGADQGPPVRRREYHSQERGVWIGTFCRCEQFSPRTETDND